MLEAGRQNRYRSLDSLEAPGHDTKEARNADVDERHGLEASG